MTTMKKRSILVLALMTVMLSSTWMSVKANSAIDINTIMPFLYQGLSYLPLGGVADLLGAPLQWDAANNNATMNYQGEELVLTPNSLDAMFAGQPVTLQSAPVLINGVTYVPASALKKYYDIPVSYDRSKSEVTIKGPKGWKKMKANTSPPWNSGPPPWAPAWGVRGNGNPGHSNDGRVDNTKKQKTNKHVSGQGRYNALEKSKNDNTSGHGKIKGNKPISEQGRYYPDNHSKRNSSAKENGKND